MTSTAQHPSAAAADPATDPEVVVALTNDESARRVAEAGVRLAHELGASVRFVHVLPERLDVQERSDADQPTFAAAMAALRRAGPHARATFESTTGDPVELLVARCAQARMLVIGPDVEGGVVGALCREHVTCPVQEVTP
ncbi:universal stress protein [Pedococcus sp. NPDC057267]|uniref:universal stress protein n=1 Tax=Pedococcus sp. NPDC057267 TaxID=3346077 RepID=UPI00363901D1